MKLFLILTIAGILLAGCSTKPPDATPVAVPSKQKENPQKENPDKHTGKPLAFKILDRETQMKGGSLKPLTKPRYKLRIVKAALIEAAPAITKESVTATLTELLKATRSEVGHEGDVYGITEFLFQSPEHANGSNGALGTAEWWPKNHTFDPTNAANIENLATHTEEFRVLLLPKSESPISDSTKLPEKTRREIFTAMVKAQDRATREAEVRFPTSATNIPIDQLKSFDFKTAFEKNSAEDDRLRNRYEGELLKQYKITESELKAISEEAFDKKWPLP